MIKLLRTLALTSFALASASAGAATASGDSPVPRSQTAHTMLYYGGPVLAKVKVVSVIWGSGVRASTVANIGPFLAGLVNSTYVDQLKQYSTNLTGVNGHAGTHQTIGRGTYVGRFKITPIHTATTVTNATIHAELRAQIKAKHLPAPDQNTLYMVYFPPSITISFGGLSCKQYNSYHWANPLTAGGNVFYGVVPDCNLGFADATVQSSSILAEAVTDPIPTFGSNPVYPQAWNTSNGYEAPSLCPGNVSTLTVGTKRYSVQQVFLNSTENCSTATYHSP